MASHQTFKAKLEIPFTLLSDADGTVCEMYGVLKEKKLDGKKRIGIERSTFLIDETGTLTEALRGVEVEGHAREVLGLLRGLFGS